MWTALLSANGFGYNGYEFDLGDITAETLAAEFPITAEGTDLDDEPLFHTDGLTPALPVVPSGGASSTGATKGLSLIHI